MEKLKEPKVVGLIDLSKFESKKSKQPEKEIVFKPTFTKEEIHFFMDKNKKVVGRAISGKIAIISFDFKGQRIKENEDWLCEIIEEQKTKIIVYPIALVKTTEQNEIECLNACENLKEFGFQKTFYHPHGTKFAWKTK
jgi:hypothetical protein